MSWRKLITVANYNQMTLFTLAAVIILLLSNIIIIRREVCSSTNNSPQRGIYVTTFTAEGAQSRSGKQLRNWKTKSNEPIFEVDVSHDVDQKNINLRTETRKKLERKKSLRKETRKLVPETLSGVVDNSGVKSEFSSLERSALSTRVVDNSVWDTWGAPPRRAKTQTKFHTTHMNEPIAVNRDVWGATRNVSTIRRTSTQPFSTTAHESSLLEQNKLLKEKLRFAEIISNTISEQSQQQKPPFDSFQKEWLSLAGKLEVDGSYFASGGFGAV